VAALAEALRERDGDASGKIRDREGAGPLHCAAWRGYDECVELLLHAGADADARDSAGESPLKAAARRGHCDCVAVLLRCGADAAATNLCNATPLHAAAAGNSDAAAAIAALLLHAGADANARDDGGWSPLHHAAASGAAAVAELLLRAGACPAGTTTRDARLEESGGVCRAGAWPWQLAKDAALRKRLARAHLAALFQPLMTRSATVSLFYARLFDAAVWRAVARFAAQ
jgi:ankyrin repeat protein